MIFRLPIALGSLKLHDGCRTAFQAVPSRVNKANRFISQRILL
ncbi:hypothetical protein GCWU000324_02363 [Kingella oralis ATCC 51147]|uniref:Uncharacterized protein n=1 Tax=Kingella oralis ATCC 51147 TaxID=629741 RepID=C4GJY9_9NEIS|nr:hypothetical protein GCWU000324_02363 [Kingella oralis ATCC 51147]